MDRVYFSERAEGDVSSINDQSSDIQGLFSTFSLAVPQIPDYKKENITSPFTPQTYQPIQHEVALSSDLGLHPPCSGHTTPPKPLPSSQHSSSFCWQQCPLEEKDSSHPDNMQLCYKNFKLPTMATAEKWNTNLVMQVFLYKSHLLWSLVHTGTAPTDYFLYQVTCWILSYFIDLFGQ